MSAPVTAHDAPSMRFYFAPMACSLAGRVLIRDAALPVQCVPVSLRRGVSEDGHRLPDLNPKSQVPVLQLPNGRLLSENLAVLSVLADLAPAQRYLPDRGTPEGLSTLEWLSFTATEIHKLCLYPIFQRSAPEAVRSWSREQLVSRLAVADARLADHAWLAGSHFSLADAYFGWALMLCPHAGVALTGYDALQRYVQQLLQRPAFADVLAEERAMYAEWA